MTGFRYWSWLPRTEGGRGDVDNAGDPAPNSSCRVTGEVLPDVLVGREDLSGVSGDKGIGVPAADGTGEIPVAETDDILGGICSEEHIVEDNTIVGGGIKVSEGVQVGDQEWALK